MPAKDIDAQGFLGPSQIGPTKAEAGHGHVGPFDPNKGPTGAEDPLGYTHLKPHSGWGSADEPPSSGD
jgi:hypothetical protein